MQLYSIMAVIFSRFELELYQTTASDMDIIDNFAPILRTPLKVKVVKDRWDDCNN